MRKRNCFLILAFVSLSTISRSQIDTTLRDFFPLRVGDVWEYEVDEYPMYPRYQVRNVGDTVLPNGKRYFHLQGPAPGGFYRIDDSMRVFFYSTQYSSCSDSEYLLYDLAIRERGIWRTCLPVVGGGDSLSRFMGLNFTISSFSLPRLQVARDTKQYCDAQIRPNGDTSFCNLVPRINYIPRRLSKGIGLVWTQFEGPATNLDGAIINGVQYGRVTSVHSAPHQSIPARPRLEPNYPNPFNPSTTIKYDLPEPAKVSLIVYDVLGRKVAELVNVEKAAGYHSIVWNAGDVASGVYIARFVAADASGYSKYSKISKLILMK